MNPASGRFNWQTANPTDLPNLVKWTKKMSTVRAFGNPSAQRKGRLGTIPCREGNSSFQSPDLPFLRPLGAMANPAAVPDSLGTPTADPMNPGNPFVGSNSNAAKGNCKGPFFVVFRLSRSAPGRCSTGRQRQGRTESLSAWEKGNN
jgi:hypothetical protein